MYLLVNIKIGKFKLFLNNEIILTEVKMKVKVSNVQDAFGARVNQDVFCANVRCKQGSDKGGRIWPLLKPRKDPPSSWV